MICVVCLVLAGIMSALSFRDLDRLEKRFDADGLFILIWDGKVGLYDGDVPLIHDWTVKDLPEGEYEYKGIPVLIYEERKVEHE